MKYKCITKAELPSVGSREHALNEAATRADYFFRQTNGGYQFPTPDGQVTQLIEMLLAAANMPPETATPEAVPVAWEFQHEETGLIDFIDPQQVEWGFEKNNPRWQKIGPVYRHPPQTQQEEESAVQQHYPCGCVTCICEDDVQCQGCGGTSCDDFKGPSCGCTHLKEETER